MILGRRIDKNILWVLAAGFALTILSLLSSGYLSIQAMATLEARSSALREHHRISTRLIDEIQGEEAGLSGIFYALAARQRHVNRDELLGRLESIEKAVASTLRQARAGSDAEQWTGAKAAVERFIAEVRGLLGASEMKLDPPASLYYAHEALVTEISNLVSANYQTAIEEEAQEGTRHRGRLRQALALLAVALTLSVICAVATVRIAGLVFRRAEWQSRELSRLSGHVLDTQEQMLHRFSRELHDEFGQTLTAIGANLAAVPAESPEVSARIEDCLLLVQDAMGSVRELSQLLRPSTLDDFGLGPSLQWLADSFAQRTGIAVTQRLEFRGRLHGETETHLFRIAQEALTNVARHSGATAVQLSLQSERGTLRLAVADNGHGLKTRVVEGLGLIGMHERMRVAGGQLEIQSSPQGVTVTAEVVLDGTEQAEAHPSLVSG
jgi:signal transduction histidine kinase